MSLECACVREPSVTSSIDSPRGVRIERREAVQTLEPLVPERTTLDEGEPLLEGGRRNQAPEVIERGVVARRQGRADSIHSGPTR